MFKSCLRWCLDHKFDCLSERFDSCKVTKHAYQHILMSKRQYTWWQLWILRSAHSAVPCTLCHHCFLLHQNHFDPHVNIDQAEIQDCDSGAVHCYRFLHMLGAVSYHHRVDVHLWLWCLWTLSAACCIYRLQDSGVFSLLHKPSIVYCQREVQNLLSSLLFCSPELRPAGALQRSNGSQRLQDSSVHQWRSSRNFWSATNKRHRAEHTENTVKMETKNKKKLFIPPFL